MSRDTRPCDPVTRETPEADSPHLMAGGTHAPGGTTELRPNVACGYGKHRHRAMGGNGIRAIHGMAGAESIPTPEAAEPGDGVSGDYREPTGGNARRAPSQPPAMARMRPDGVWDGD